jgi:hypothetical protein
MNLIKSGQQLPARVEDLAQFVLIGTEQLTAVRAAIRALDKLNVASDVYHQKLQEAQDLGEAVLDAKVKVGELALAAPKATGHQENRGNRYKTQEDRETAADRHFSTPKKEEIVKSIGVPLRTIRDWQQLAQHPELVEEAKQQARQSGEIVGSTVAIQLIKKQNEIQKYKPHITDEEIELNIGDEWYTPDWIFKALQLTFDIDVCSPLNLKHCVVPAYHRFTIKDDGLTQDWSGLIWCNPPYSNPEPWAERMIEHGNGLFLTSIPMNAEWAAKVWHRCDGLRLLQSMVFQRPDGNLERPALWLQIAAFGQEASDALRNMTIPQDIYQNLRRVPSPFFKPII